MQSDPKWSPDGRKIAFVSTRTDHSFIMVYDVATRTVKYMSPSVDFDTAPMWMPDSKHLIFMRQPGLPFGQQTQQGGGGIGLPPGPRRAADAARDSRGNTHGTRRSPRRARQSRRMRLRLPAVTNNSPGLMRSNV